MPSTDFLAFLVQPPCSQTAPSARYSKPSYETTTKRTCPKYRIYNSKKPYLIGSWILNGKYAPNENITLTAEVTKLLPWVFDTGDPVP